MLFYGKDIKMNDIDTSKKRLDGVILIAIYQFISSIPGLILGIAVLAIALPAVIQGVHDQIGLIAAIFGISLVTLFTLGLSIISIVSGIGLIAMKNWARWIACTLALSIIWAVPIGTLIGCLILFYLLQEDVKQHFVSK